MKLTLSGSGTFLRHLGVWGGRVWVLGGGAAGHKGVWHPETRRRKNEAETGVSPAVSELTARASSFGCGAAWELWPAAPAPVVPIPRPRPGPSRCQVQKTFSGDGLTIRPWWPHHRSGETESGDEGTGPEGL